jgi:two-component system cell cycle response regulator CpdR
VARVVLLVDDEPLVCAVAAMMLEDLGCEVVTASDAADALEKLATNSRIEILITDINMPGMDGYILAQTATQMRDLKVIMLSGHEHDGGGFPLVRKPFLRDDLKKDNGSTHRSLLGEWPSSVGRGRRSPFPCALDCRRP